MDGARERTMSRPVTTMANDGVMAAGATDTGLQREVNEDRFHVDPARGVFLVIDGVGGHAAGGRAADIALAMLRARLERETGPITERLREAIAIANGEILRLAATRPEWHGMACVLTAAIVGAGRATVGHVGDTRLYKLRGDLIEKVTRDHSPVGEREDAAELSEAEAMRHPRRNEVYRDVGSEPHAAHDPEFVDIEEVMFEPDAALLLCSDGLTDLVSAASIARLVKRHAGDPAAVVQALIGAANEAGGKDNITAVWVEGPEFARSVRATAPTTPRRSLAIATLAAVISAAAMYFLLQPDLLPLVVVPQAGSATPAADIEVVGPDGSINAAISRARPGSAVLVEPGEYREQIRLRSHVRVVSRVPRAATLRLPAAATDVDPAVIASNVRAAELSGFRIVGDAATPLGVGLFVTDAAIALQDIEISGATKAAVDISSGGTVSLLGGELHDNPGAGLSVRAGGQVRVAHSLFTRNGTAEQAAAMRIDPGAEPVFHRNVFQGMTPDLFAALDDQARAVLARDNWFLALPRPALPAATPASRRR
jgi:PPM family protein phosphatase